MKTIINTKSPNSLIEAVMEAETEKGDYFKGLHLFDSCNNHLLWIEPCFNTYHLPAITEEVANCLLSWGAWRRYVNSSPNTEITKKAALMFHLTQFLTDHGYTLREGERPFDPEPIDDDEHLTSHIAQGRQWDKIKAWENALDPNGLVIKFK